MAYGNVEPAKVLKVKAEVNGKISYRHSELKQGGSLPTRTAVLKIKTTSCEISPDTSQTGLSNSQSSLKQIIVWRTKK